LAAYQVFRELVRAYRRRLGLTQQDLADKAGLGVRSIRKIEAGDVKAPRPTTVRLLASAFGLTGADRDRFVEAAAQAQTDQQAVGSTQPPSAEPESTGEQLPSATDTPVIDMGPTSAGRHSTMGRDTGPPVPEALRETADQLARVLAVAIGLAAAASLTVWIAFLIGRSLSEADSWSSTASTAIAFVAAATALVVWLVQRSRRATADDAGNQAFATLRAEVQAAWVGQATRSMFLPRPLRLRWRGEPVMQARGLRHQVVDGELLARAGDGRPAAMALVEIFADPNVRQLVVLGEAGAGKSTLATLFTVAAATSGESTAPVPIPLSLAGFTLEGVELKDWIIARVQLDYSIGADQARLLINGGRIIAVLDGLDEVPRGRRESVMMELERAAASGLRVMVTCRTREYFAITGEWGPLPQAVVAEIQSIEPADVAEYLAQRDAQASMRWDPVVAALESTSTGPLASALSTPLMVSLARQIYQRSDTDPGELLTLHDSEVVRQRLVDRFLPAVYGPQRAPRAGRWLASLAHRLSSHPFDPDLRWWWLARTVPRVVIVAQSTAAVAAFAAVVSASIALLDGKEWLPYVIWGAAVGAIFGFVTGLQASRAARTQVDIGVRLSWSQWMWVTFQDLIAVVALLSALSSAALIVTRTVSPDASATVAMYGIDTMRAVVADGGSIGFIFVAVLAVLLLVSMTSGLITGRAGTPRRRSARFRELPRHLVPGLGIATIIVAFLSLGFALTPELGDLGEWLWFAPLLTLEIAVFFWLTVGLGRWLSSPVTGVDVFTPEGSLRSDRAVLLSTVIGTAGAVGIVTATLAGVGGSPSGAAKYGLAAAGGLAALLFFGSGSAWLIYQYARTWYALTGRLPWRLSSFVREAHHNGVLRQAGMAYQIRHEVVRTHILQVYAPKRVRGADARSRWPTWWPVPACSVALTLLAAVAVGMDPRPTAFLKAEPTILASAELPPSKGVLFDLQGDSLLAFDPSGRLGLWRSTDGHALASYDHWCLERDAELTDDGDIVYVAGVGCNPPTVGCRRQAHCHHPPIHHRLGLRGHSHWPPGPCDGRIRP